MGADKDWLTRLKNLVEGGDIDFFQVNSRILDASGGDGAGQHVMHRACRDLMVEVVVEELGDAAFGTMTRQGQTEHHLFEPRFGDRQPEQEILGHLRRRSKGFIETLLGLGDLLVHELAADLIVAGGMASRFLSSEHTYCHVAALLGLHRFGRARSIRTD